MFDEFDRDLNQQDRSPLTVRGYLTCKPWPTTAVVSGVIVSQVQGHQPHIKDTHWIKGDYEILF